MEGSKQDRAALQVSQFCVATVKIAPQHSKGEASTPGEGGRKAFSRSGQLAGRYNRGAQYTVLVRAPGRCRIPFTDQATMTAGKTYYDMTKLLVQLPVNGYESKRLAVVVMSTVLSSNETPLKFLICN
jgi:hypothetical protein